MKNMKNDNIRLNEAEEQEKVTKSCQTANLLVQDLKEMAKVENQLLGSIALDLLSQAIQIENKLKEAEKAESHRGDNQNHRPKHRK